MDLVMLREALGLAADADDLEVSAALVASGLVPVWDSPASVAAATAPWREQLERTSSELANLKAARAQEQRDAVVGAAVRAGKITPAERAAWESRFDAAPEVVAGILAEVDPGSAVPISPVGYAGTPEGDEGPSTYAALYGRAPAGREG